MTGQPAPVDPLSSLLNAAAERAVSRALEQLAAFAEKPSADVLDDAGVMTLLSVSRPTLRGLLADGLPHARLGSLRRYIRTDVIDWVRAQLSPGRPCPSDVESAEHEREAEEALG